jgi:hypothetical protein
MSRVWPNLNYIAEFGSRHRSFQRALQAPQVRLPKKPRMPLPCRHWVGGTATKSGTQHSRVGGTPLVMGSMSACLHTKAQTSVARGIAQPLPLRRTHRLADDIDHRTAKCGASGRQRANRKPLAVGDFRALAWCVRRLKVDRIEYSDIVAHPAAGCRRVEAQKSRFAHKSVPSFFKELSGHAFG